MELSSFSKCNQLKGTAFASWDLQGARKFGIIEAPQKNCSIEAPSSCCIVPLQDDCLACSNKRFNKKSIVLELPPILI